MGEDLKYLVETLSRRKDYAPGVYATGHALDGQCGCCVVVARFA